MPTFAAIALENLLEPGVRDSCKKPPNHGVTTDGSEEAERREDSTENPRVGVSKHIYISPALYATPEPDSIPGNYSPISSSPSPYVVNHKRRCGGEKITRRIESCEVQDLTPKNDGNDLVVEDEVVEDNFVDENEGSKAENDGEDDFEGFLDPRSERLSVGSFDYFEAKQIESPSLDSAQGEFFDANDEFSSSSSSGSSRGFRLEQDLHASKISLLEEVERRKFAEENLKLMCFQWERISNLMSQAGLTFPPPPTVTDSSMQAENNSMDQLSHEVIVARFVAEAVGRGEARAEAELAANAILELKDQEISRLQDKLLYYETMNHEMSQRNLVEVARRHQQRRSRPRKWLWSCLGLSIAVAASVLAYSYIPSMSKHQPLLDSGDSIDASHISTSSQTP